MLYRPACQRERTISYDELCSFFVLTLFFHQAFFSPVHLRGIVVICLPAIHTLIHKCSINLIFVIDFSILGSHFLSGFVYGKAPVNLYFVEISVVRPCLNSLFHLVYAGDAFVQDTCLARAENSISAIFSQEPCLRVYSKSIRLLNSPALCTLRCS